MNLEPHNFPFAVWEWNRASEVCAVWNEARREKGLPADDFCLFLQRVITEKECLLEQSLIFWTDGEQLYQDSPAVINWGAGEEWGKNIFIPAELARYVLNL